MANNGIGGGVPPHADPSAAHQAQSALQGTSQHNPVPQLDPAQAIAQLQQQAAQQQQHNAEFSNMLNDVGAALRGVQAQLATQAQALAAGGPAPMPVDNDGAESDASDGRALRADIEQVRTRYRGPSFAPVRVQLEKFDNHSLKEQRCID